MNTMITALNREIAYWASVRLAVLSLLWFVVVTPDAFAMKYCTCVASTGTWNSGVVRKFDNIESYRNTDIHAPRKCSKKCSALVSGKIALGTPTSLCASMNWTGGCIRGFGYIGRIGTHDPDATVGQLICNAPKPAETQQKCPQGWLSNTNNQDGGVTRDGKCKKVVCQPINPPLPPNGTALGTWGFTWGNALYRWGPSNRIEVRPPQRGSASWSTCP